MLHHSAHDAFTRHSTHPLPSTGSTVLCCRAQKHSQDITATEAWHAGLCIQPEDTCAGENHASVSHASSALPCKCFLLRAPSVEALKKTTELARLLTSAHPLHVAQDGESSIQLSCCRGAEILLSVTGVALQLCSAYLGSCLLLGYWCCRS